MDFFVKRFKMIGHGLLIKLNLLTLLNFPGGKISFFPIHMFSINNTNVVFKYLSPWRRPLLPLWFIYFFWFIIVSHTVWSAYSFTIYFYFCLTWLLKEAKSDNQSLNNLSVDHVLLKETLFIKAANNVTCSCHQCSMYKFQLILCSCVFSFLTKWDSNQPA